jgi:DNA-binding GntR family transcriptional regulator
MRKPATSGQAGTFEIVTALRERIASQQFLSGRRLREQELSEEFGVSRSRIREAFGALEERGLIERIPNRGAVVARLDHNQLFDLFDVREMLEGLCARLATQMSQPGDWDDFARKFGGPMARHVARGELFAYLETYEQFRESMIEAAQNPLLKDMLDSIHDKTRVLIRRIIILPGRAAQGLKEHRALLAAMRKGDADAAERLKRINIASSRDYLKRYKDFLL